jgi:acetyl esterase/lipase
MYDAIWSLLPPLGYPILRLLRAFLSGWPLIIYNMWWRRQPTHMAVDSKSIQDGVIITSDHPYGEEDYETLDEIMPAQPDPAIPPVLYAHGGGFVAVSSRLLIPSVTPLARAGCVVFSMDYPLAPEHPWPAAALSTLRAMRYVRKRTKADRIALVGDSAGGNLVAYAAALLTDRAMLAQLAAHTGEKLLEWDLPAVSSVCSVYGFLDGESWRTTYLTSGLDYCWRSYFPSQVEESGGERRLSGEEAGRTLKKGSGSGERHLTGEETGHTHMESTTNLPPLARHLLEFEPSQLDGFPPTLLIAATGDPLMESTLRASVFLRAAGVAVNVERFDAPHGFLGIPPQWSFGAWKYTSAPAMETIVRFLTSRDVKYPRDALPWDLSVWALVFPLLSVQFELCCLAADAGIALAKTVVRLAIGLAEKAAHRLRKSKASSY